MEFKDYYRTLGVDPKASRAEIKQAYQRLARRYHPDLSKEPEAEARFKEINEAYQVLRDARARHNYDLLGAHRRQGPGQGRGQGFRPSPDWYAGERRRGGNPSFSEQGGFSDFFSSLFAGARPIRGFDAASGVTRTRGADLRQRVRLSLEEAYRGVRRTLSVRILEPASQGKLVSKIRKTLVRIPPGVYEGQQIRLVQQGNPGTGDGPSGDLLLEIVFAPHPHFRTKGRDVWLELPIAPWEAALGARLKIPTLGGAGMITLAPGVKSGHKLRLKGRGLPGDPPGDQLIVLRIETPPASSEEAVRLYRKMAEVMSFDPRGKRGL